MARTFLHPYEALSLVTSNFTETKSEFAILKDSCDRVLLNDIKALYDDPPFSKSSMDGYAYNSLSATKVLKLIKDKIIQAGDSVDIDIPLGQCIKIMTGARLPQNCDRVQRVEWTSIDNDNIILTKEEMSSNVIKQAENIKAGDLILNKKVLKPKDIAILASSGIATIEVYKKIKVAIYSTGNELMDIGSKIEGSKIYDSNGYMLYTSLLKLGCDTDFLGIIDDDESVLKKAILSIIDKYDIVIFSGGVSMGDFDLLPKVFSDISVREIFHGLKMKPGKPCYFGKCDNKKNTAIFALPGNPLSSFVCFHLFVKNYILSCFRLYKNLDIKEAFLNCDYKRNDRERFEFIPAYLYLEEGQVFVKPIVAKSSSMLQVLNNTNSLITIEPDIGEYKANDKVSVMILGGL